MVKSADTADLKSADPYQVVGVQVPLRAPVYPIKSEIYVHYGLSSARGPFVAGTLWCRFVLDLLLSILGGSILCRERLRRRSAEFSRRFRVLAFGGFATTSMAANAARRWVVAATPSSCTKLERLMRCVARSCRTT